MFTYILDQIPVPIRHALDGAAISVGVAHWWLGWKENIGTITATAGLIWLIIQAVYFFKDYYFPRKRK